MSTSTEYPERATELVWEAALILRAATSIEDPYFRADRIWDGVELLRESFEHARTRACERLAFALEEICDGTGVPPGDEALLRHARALEHYAQTLGGLRAGEDIASLTLGGERAAA